MTNKNPFTVSTVRVYSTDLATELNESFKRAETSFASNRSAFLVHLIELGLGIYNKTVEVKRQNMQGPVNSTTTDIEDFKNMLNDYFSYSRKENQKSKEQLDICQALGSAILNILVSSLDGEFIDKEACDAGMYDETPKRFVKAGVA